MEINGVSIAKQEYVSEHPIDELVEHPNNSNVGDEDSILESIEASGFYGSVLAQKSSSRIIVGNHRWRSLKKKKAKTIPVLFLDVSDVEAMRIMLVDNKTASAAEFDDRILEASLESIASTEKGLSGTGFDESDLVALRDDIALPVNQELERGVVYRISIGNFVRAKMSRATFENWKQSVVEEIGSDNPQEIVNEVRRRLGLVG